MKKRGMLIILVSICVLVLVSCSEVVKIEDRELEVASSETMEITEEDTTVEEVTTENDSVQEITTIVETTTESETTTKESSVEETTSIKTETPKYDEYISSRNYDDKAKVRVLGDLDVSQEELSKIEELIKSYNREMSFKVVSIDGSKGLSYNSDRTYFAASSIKAPYLLYCHKEIDKGNGTLEEKMKYLSSYYKDGSGIINQSPSGTEYTLAEIMRLVVWCSDNSGYYMCTKRWGLEGYNSYVSSIGCNGLKLSNGYIWVDNANAHDLVTVWKDIYDYIKSDAPSAKHMYDICTDYKYNPLENALPGVTIAQKYGTSTTKDVFCDGAIIYGKKNTYILAFFLDSTNDSKDKNFVTNLVKEINSIMDR